MALHCYFCYSVWPHHNFQHCPIVLIYMRALEDVEALDRQGLKASHITASEKKLEVTQHLRGWRFAHDHTALWGLWESLGQRLLIKTSFREREEGSGGEHREYVKAGLLDNRIFPCLVIEQLQYPRGQSVWRRSVNYCQAIVKLPQDPHILGCISYQLKV